MKGFLVPNYYKQEAVERGLTLELWLSRQGYEVAWAAAQRSRIQSAPDVDDADLVNPFDYFQEARLGKAKKVTLQDLTFDPRWKRRADGVSYNYYDGDRRVVYVRRHQRDKHVMKDQYFDRNGKMVKVAW